MRRLVNQRPTRGGTLVLSMMPFVLLIAAYLAASSARLSANPGDRQEMIATSAGYAFKEALLANVTTIFVFGGNREITGAELGESTAEAIAVDHGDRRF